MPNWIPLGPIWLLTKDQWRGKFYYYVDCALCAFNGQLPPRRENVQYKAAVDLLNVNAKTRRQGRL